MKVTKNSSKREPCPAGTHVSQLVGIIDYGTQADKFGSRRKVEFLWETPEELFEFNEERGEEPFILDRKFALTIGKKSALKECIEGMLGITIEDDELELNDYLGTMCQLNLVHEKDGDYVNEVIKSYMPLSKSDVQRFKKHKPHNELIILDLSEFDVDVWNSESRLLPDWKKDIIKKSPEMKEIMAENPKWFTAATPAAKSKTTPPTPPAKGSTKTKSAAKKGKSILDED